MTTLLVANRGEIAVRIFATARRLGMRTVAVYSDADAGAAHVRAADDARRIGPAEAGSSYLRADAVVEAALDAGAGLVHPGYGFLAEDARFAEACASAGLTFVGPPGEVLRAVGDKVSARRLAVEAGVPVLDGYDGSDQSDAAFTEAAGSIGYPVLVKPSGGGGGKGMRVVTEPRDLPEALAAARRLAKAAFADDRLLLERYLEGPRHVEVQVLADAHGTVLHLGERDCSLQRRHQKILEESPAPGLDPAVASRLHEAAVSFARTAGYLGAGTCEFLVGRAGEAGFIEMNARLQVEHPVTEAVTGVDLVELQLRVAMGEELPIAQPDVRLRGHAVEVRVYAEAPEAGFLPQTGTVDHVAWPRGARVDAGVEEGSEVTAHYDPMLAKIVVHGADRPAALAALDEALEQTQLLGVRTNLAFLRGVCADRVVREAEITTDWLDSRPLPAPTAVPPSALAVAAASEAERILAARTSDPWSALGPWRAGGRSGLQIVARVEGDERVSEVSGNGPFGVGGGVVARDEGCHRWLLDGRPGYASARALDGWLVWAEGDAHEIAIGPAPRRAEGGAGSRLESPLPGTVVAVRAEAGRAVQAGDELVVVEAMKMEHGIRAPTAGTVRRVLCAPGDQVARGQVLVDFEPAD